MAVTPQHVGVIGGGRMGAGIAHVFALAGSSVVVIERDQPSVDAARERLESSATKAAAYADVDSQSLMARLTVSSSYADLAPAELVIEAVPEVLALKVEALTAAEGVVSSKAWLATNTSSLPVAEIGGALARPERFCGLHFFNPVPPSALVEIVATPRTSDKLLTQAVEWVAALQKTAITVTDAPGFASSRLGNAIALEAMRMLEEGVASAEDIDAAMVLGYRHATGPLRTSDLVGLDVRLNIAEHLHQTLGERFAPPKILRDKVAAGELGRKAGRGFFDYD